MFQDQDTMLGLPHNRRSIALVGAFPLALVTTAFLGPSAFAQPRDVNYDEAKVGQYTLPDPLVTSSNLAPALR